MERIEQALIRKFIYRTCTAEELKQVLEILDTEEGQQYLTVQLDELENDPHSVTEHDEISSERVLSRLSQQIKKDPELKRSVNVFLQPWLKVAATVTILMALSWGVFYVVDSFQPVTYVNVETGNDKKHLFLPDSTEVWLNVSSKLRYPDKFSDDGRTVFLEGEGFFHVKRDVHKPFKVIAEDLETKVLGTSFNVSAAKGSSQAEVLVFTGKVSVSDRIDGRTTNETALLPHERLIVWRKTKKRLKEFVAEIDNYRGWREDRLVFHKTPMPQVVDVLNHHYKVNIVLDSGDIDKMDMTAKFESQKIDEVLDLICLLLKAKYRREGEVYRLSSKNAPESIH